MDKSIMITKIKEMFPDYESDYMEEPEIETEDSGWELVRHVMEEMMPMIQQASLEERMEAAKIILW